MSGAASVALRPTLEGPRRPARVLAAFPLAVYLEVRTETEPHVLALVTADAIRLPNAVVLGTPANQPGGAGGMAAITARITAGDEAWVGERGVGIGGLGIGIRRWWDPAPSLGVVDPSQLATSLGLLGEIRTAASRQPGLGLSGAPALLARSCQKGALADSVSAAEQLIGLGPGLTPSGDDMLAGLLVTLRQLGIATSAGRAVWLADWLAATVTYDARTRTTPISATLLHCAATAQCSPEVLGVLRGAAGRQPLEPAVQRLLRVGHTSGADLLWGVCAGLSAVLSLGRG